MKNAVGIINEISFICNRTDLSARQKRRDIVNLQDGCGYQDLLDALALALVMETARRASAETQVDALKVVTVDSDKPSGAA